MISLTPSQQKAYDIIMSGSNVLLTAPGGAGKSFLTKLIIAELRQKGLNVIVCAPTGIAAMHIGGTTIHRAFGFPSSVTITSARENVMVRAPKLIQAADVIIIDEVSMCRMDLFDSIVSSVEKAEEHSGRHKQLIVIGDFYQLPPVVTDEDREPLTRFYGKPIGNAYAFQAAGWQRCHFVTVELTEIVRQSDPDFITNINKIRVGDKSGILYFNTHAIPYDYPSGINLYAFNKDVDAVNQAELDRLPGETHTYKAVVEGELRTENLHELEIPAELTIKEGARVIFTANDTPHGDLLDDDWYNLRQRRFSNKGNLFRNGTLGTVVDIDCRSNGIYVETDDNERVRVPLYTYNIYRYMTDENNIVHREVAGTCRQYPLRLAYAMTIHRGQGQTYETVNIMPRCILPGQLYVALSRVTSIRGMHLMEFIDPQCLLVDPSVREFYTHVNDAGYVPSWDVTHTMGKTRQDGTEADDKPVKLGRPVKYPNGTKPVSLPVEAAEALQKAVKAKVCPSAGNFSQAELTRLTGLLLSFAAEVSTTQSNGETPSECSTKPARGRPAKYPNGVKTVSLPVEIADAVHEVLKRLSPFSQKVYDHLLAVIHNF